MRFQTISFSYDYGGTNKLKQITTNYLVTMSKDSEGNNGQFNIFNKTCTHDLDSESYDIKIYNEQSSLVQVSETPLLKVENVGKPSDVKDNSDQFQNDLGLSKDENINSESDESTSDEDEKAEYQESIPEIQEIYKYVNKVYSDQAMLIKTMESNITESTRWELNDVQKKLNEMGGSIAIINGRLTANEENIENIKRRLDHLEKNKNNYIQAERNRK